MTEVAVAHMPVIPSMKGLQRNLTNAMAPAAAKASDQVGQTMGARMSSRLSSGLKTGVKVAGAGVATVLGTSLVKGFQRLSAIENAEAKLTGLGNSAADTSKIMDNALAAVKGTAFGMDEAATTAASAVAAGVKPGQDLTKYLGLVGDAATIAGTDMGSMGSIFNKVMTSGKVQGDVFAQLSDSGIPVVQMLADSMGIAADEVYDLGSKGKISSDEFLKAMGSMEGAALKGGETTTGAWKNMMAALSRFGAGMLKGIYPAIGPTFNKITAMLDAAEAKVTPFVATISEKLGNAMSNLDFSSWSNFTSSLSTTSGALGREFGPALSSVGESLGTLRPAMSEFVRQLPQIGGSVVTLAVSGVKLLAGALGFLADHSDTIVRFMPAIVAGFVAWRVASTALAYSSQKLQWAQVAMAPVLLTNNALRLINITLENRQTRARIANTAATSTNTTATAANNTAQNMGVFARIRAVAATVAHRVAVVASAIATRTAAAAQWLFNAALSANPIGLVILAITALVAGLVWFFTQTQLGQQIWSTVWTAIKTIVAGVVAWFQTVVLPMLSAAVSAIGAAFQWLYANVILPVWNGIKVAVAIVIAVVMTIIQGLVWFVRSVLGPAFTWLYVNIIVPVWNGIRNAISAAWNFIRDVILVPLIGFVRGTLTAAWTWLRTIVAAVWGAIRGAITAAWNWIRNAVLVPLIGFVRGVLTNAWIGLRILINAVWSVIRAVISSAWNWIRGVVLNPLIGFLKGPLAGAWNWLRGLIERVWSGIKSAVSGAWNWVRGNVLDPMINFVRNNVVSAWETAKSGIETAWNKIKSIVSKPVDFVVNTVINDGFIKNFNKIAEKFKIDKIPEVSFRGFRTGGYTGDKYRKDEVAGLVHGQEEVIRAESTRDIERAAPGFLDRLNKYGASALPTFGHDGHAAHGGLAAGGPGGPGTYLWGPLQNAIYRTGIAHLNGGASGYNIGAMARAWNNMSNLKVKHGSGQNQITVGPGAPAGTWGYAWTNGTIRLNTGIPGGMKTGTGAHEVGHVLGLDHAGTNSIMHPMMRGPLWPSAYDRSTIQRIYGGAGKGNPPEGGGDSGPSISDIASSIWDKLKGIVNFDSLLGRIPGGGFATDLMKGAAKTVWDGFKGFVSKTITDAADKIIPDWADGLLGKIFGAGARPAIDGVWDSPVGSIQSLRPGVNTIYNGTGSSEYFQRVAPMAASADRVGTVELSATDRALLRAVADRDVQLSVDGRELHTTVKKLNAKFGGR